MRYGVFILLYQILNLAGKCDILIHLRFINWKT